MSSYDELARKIQEAEDYSKDLLEKAKEDEVKEELEAEMTAALNRHHFPVSPFWFARIAKVMMENYEKDWSAEDAVRYLKEKTACATWLSDGC